MQTMTHLSFKGPLEHALYDYCPFLNSALISPLAFGLWFSTSDHRIQAHW